MNYMKEVAQMLGVELGEMFGITNSFYSYRVTEKNVEYYDGLNQCWAECNYRVISLLNGSDEIIKMPKPILDDAEKEYLSNVIKPFRDKVNYIVKTDMYEYELISINFDNEETGAENINFPCFFMGKMYKGMELDKKYTLEELGL